ncbi:hypothetical protein BgiBS90_035841 [Biomphalaria glabrata]|nr:hypothetical protein BgiBS90_035841 [Biomphalaria glabrata]
MASSAAQMSVATRGSRSNDKAPSLPDLVLMMQQSNWLWDQRSPWGMGSFSRNVAKNDNTKKAKYRGR